jgi:hypothetical protein
LHIAHPGFFLSPVRKSVPRPGEVQKSGLGNEISHPHTTILETSWKFSEITEISWKFRGSPKIAWKLWQKICIIGPLSNRFMKIVYNSTNLHILLFEYRLFLIMIQPFN